MTNYAGIAFVIVMFLLVFVGIPLIERWLHRRKTASKAAAERKAFWEETWAHIGQCAKCRDQWFEGEPGAWAADDCPEAQRLKALEPRYSS